MFIITHFFIFLNRFYSFELLKAGPWLSTPQATERIRVHDISIENTPILRSGRLLANRKKVFYEITRNDQKETVDQVQLKFLKKILGEDSLVYDPTFSESEKQKYVI